ncbi:MAG: RNA polymerase sigma factor, partial [Altibacter sp.]|nr:RNA polymerase sigma factor [Altibacter sp.]
MGERIRIQEQLALTEAIKNNNELVLNRLYQENFKKVELFILKNNGTMPYAKDIYQEAFITVWKNIRNDSFTPQNETAIQGYLYKIAKNKWLDVLRSGRYKKTVALQSLHTAPQEETDGVSHPLEEQEDLAFRNVMMSFNTIGEPCKELLQQFYYEKKSLREIALFLQIDEASAR